ncbi:MAG: hypothetical protein ACHQHN_15260 [Sphingobacteriales bacterium]
MKKALIFSLLVLSSLSACLAQDSHTRGLFSIGIEGGFVASDYDRYLMKNLFKTGIGASMKIEVPVYPNIYFTAAGGFSTFEATDKTKAYINQTGLNQYAQYSTSENFELLKIGAKCYIVKGLFMEAQAGGVFHSDKTVEFMPNRGLSIAYSAGTGYLFHNGIELGARYEVWRFNGSVSKMNQLGIRLAYALKFPRG